MPVVKAPIEQANRASVHPARDGWRFPCDRWRNLGPSGDRAWFNGGCVSSRVVYVGIAFIVAVACLVETFSLAHDIARRGGPYNFGLSLLLVATSGAMIIALLSLPRHGARIASKIASQPMKTTMRVLAVALVFSAIHIAGMVLLRKLAYAAGGATYSFNWSIAEILYEMRKDLFSFMTIGITFWLAERAFGIAGLVGSPRGGAAAMTPEAVSLPQAATQFWLRDGRANILVSVREILWVASAGNYVEYALAGGQRHLIRTTLQAEEQRLSKVGIVRIHRSRLVNLKRIVAVVSRTTGDFELRLDTGEVIPGSRRHKTAVAGLGA
jgi:LytTr DNA-binding domain